MDKQAVQLNAQASQPNKTKSSISTFNRLAQYLILNSNLNKNHKPIGDYLDVRVSHENNDLAYAESS